MMSGQRLCFVELLGGNPTNVYVSGYLVVNCH